MMARNTNVPFKGRIQKRKTYHLQIITFRLQRAAGPYRSARKRHMQCSKIAAYSITSSAAKDFFCLPCYPLCPGGGANVAAARTGNEVER